MRFEVRLEVEASSSQKAVALVQKLSAEVEADPDLQLLNAGQAQTTHLYVVKGVNTKTKEPFEEHVEEATPEAAHDSVQDERRVVVAVELAG